MLTNFSNGKGIKNVWPYQEKMESKKVKLDIV